MKKMVTFLLIIYHVSSVCCFLDDILQPLAHVFEYGDNYGDQTFVQSGKISLFEKKFKIPISVPTCSEITYVRVEVNNVANSPNIQYLEPTQTVEITYGPLQYSRSSYNVIAKTAPKKYCKETQSRVHQKRCLSSNNI
ncbi:uncharacterized protein LOC120624051 [Pararge aegeria]|uniref:Jg3853 protein n=1 Tax=Pararge aegeria aegeria TaxID=348720 RepID=A0A8S4S326_9NEOP|nr:uncharacterized protein LOC120624051 [Pararge aegeria]CAH2244624.1 jg3853 [Pararge aegeria aegeria]